MYRPITCLLVGLLLLSGCAVKKEQVYRNLYNGLQKREELVQPTDRPAAQAPQSYDAYSRERQPDQPGQ